MAYTYRDTPVGFHRLNKMPLDDREVFNSVTALIDYINSGAAYYGQRVMVKLNYYDQNVTLKKGKGSKLVPILEGIPGYEPIVKTQGSNRYVLVYYYNGGKAFSSVKEQVRTVDAFAWSILPQASLIYGNDAGIEYLLEYDPKDGTSELSFSFSQPNPATNTVALNDGNTVERISSVANSKAFFPTVNNKIGIMQKTKTDSITRLWVKANDYVEALGVL